MRARRGVHADRPQRCRQDHGVQPDQPHLPAHQGEITSGREAPHRRARARIASLGIARTFQNIELFEHATVLHNLLIGATPPATFWSDLLFFTRHARAGTASSRAKVEQVIDLLDLQHHRDIAGGRPALRRAQGGGTGPRAVHRAPRCCCWTSPSSGLNVEETDDMAFWIQDIARAGHHGADGRARHVAGVAVSDRVLAMNQGGAGHGHAARGADRPGWSRPTWARSTMWLRCGGPHEAPGRG